MQYVKLKKGVTTQSFDEKTADYLLTKGWEKVGEVKAPAPISQQIVNTPSKGKD